jgi:glycosyltransferase involved in cell wall biosynthesis
VYTGNVHAANAHEVRSLYLAVAILNREGVPATLVRAGRDYYPFLGPNEDWGRSNAVELGFVAHIDICAVLALADVLVQPGKADAFNDYRFPSKLPEFMSVGRPVILPNTNIGKRMLHRRHAYLLADPSAVSIADAIREIMSDKDLYDTLSTGSLEFCRQYLSWQQSAHKLHNFYSSMMPVRQLAATA